MVCSQCWQGAASRIVFRPSYHLRDGRLHENVLVYGHHAASRARCPHRSRDTPLTRPWGLDGGIHAANGPAIGEDTAPDSWLVVLLKAMHAGLQQTGVKSFTSYFISNTV
ncbi:hypothetical protein [Xanthomonas sp. 3793]|uniref:hypothetical protein n=1 Tax=Xanthomonas sp. 3793 TaxID=3035312 RepID=UPI00216AA87C|nr:hypothetical protein [Xanthomonas sp. 3793]